MRSSVIPNRSSWQGNRQAIVTDEENDTGKIKLFITWECHNRLAEGEGSPFSLYKNIIESTVSNGIVELIDCDVWCSEFKSIEHQRIWLTLKFARVTWLQIISYASVCVLDHQRQTWNFHIARLLWGGWFPSEKNSEAERVSRRGFVVVEHKFINYHAYETVRRKK